MSCVELAELLTPIGFIATDGDDPDDFPADPDTEEDPITEEEAEEENVEEALFESLFPDDPHTEEVP